MISEKNATYLYVGNVTNGYSDTNDVNPDTMPLGSVALVKAESISTGGREFEAGAISGNTTTKYQIINKTSTGEVRISPAFYPGDIVSKTGQAYVQPTEQVSFLGYDGSAISGLGTFVAGDEYLVRFVLKHTQNTLNNTPELKHIGYYALGTTQAAAAKAFMESFLYNFSKTREPNTTILCDRVALTTSVAALGGSGTVAKVTNGSKTVLAYIKATAANATLTADDFSVTIDDVINIPSYNGRTFTFDCLDAVGHTAHIGTESYYIADQATAADGSDNATALAAAINAGSSLCTASAATATVTITVNEGIKILPPMVFSDVASSPARVAVTIASGDTVAVKYKAAATATTAASFELDEPWQGPTGYIHDHTVEATSIGIATLTSDTWGLKFTGVTQPFVALTDVVRPVEFDVLAGDLDLTEYKSVTPTRGSGSGKEVAALENYTQGMDRFYVGDDMIKQRTFEAVNTYGYDLITLNITQAPYTIATTGTRIQNNFTIILALKDTLSGDYFDTNFAVSV